MLTQRILLLGAGGQLGSELCRALAPLGELTAWEYPAVDFTQPLALRQQVLDARPQLIVNAAAYTAVDQAEREPEVARLVNAAAVAALAEAAARLNAGLVHYSTDYVFDGETATPYDESEPPNPINAYGQTKLEGEQAALAHAAVWVLRTSWVYSRAHGGFVAKVLAWARQQPTLRVVSDQIGSPTWARALAHATAQALRPGAPDLAGWVAGRRGLYHAAGRGAVSRLEWARAILAHDPQASEHQAREVQPAASSEFPTPARRPRYTALDCGLFERTFGFGLPPWEESLRQALGEE